MKPQPSPGSSSKTGTPKAKHQLQREGYRFAAANRITRDGRPVVTWGTEAPHYGQAWIESAAGEFHAHHMLSGKLGSYLTWEAAALAVDRELARVAAIIAGGKRSRR